MWGIWKLLHSALTDTASKACGGAAAAAPLLKHKLLPPPTNEHYLNSEKETLAESPNICRPVLKRGDLANKHIFAASLNHLEQHCTTQFAGKAKANTGEISRSLRKGLRGCFLWTQPVSPWWGHTLTGQICMQFKLGAACRAGDVCHRRESVWERVMQIRDVADVWHGLSLTLAGRHCGRL